MGRREPRDRFMPDVYVFPGGRVDPTDALVPAKSELRPHVAARLERTTSQARARARALAVAAIRETFEETGLVLGERDSAGLRPSLGHLDYVARAITPAGNPIRYHARFFLADGETLDGELRSNGELLDLAWVPIGKALELNIIDVTEFVLGEAAAHLSGSAEPGVPFVHYHRGTRRIRRD
jgi:8-oxo-dGTP pyrophosphatase MutT (NUDIX family)